mmetsp:Transcript_12167/g.18160  ORF Transcript_12167/g.18160 Transcript_12167/m.18160 type:complete len:499 (-) Transcript_12167:201-1697(-)|eukprot:CAMPEP_0167762334 /NCGR_PEP_ID=MMETSP0110_2-20121227/12706_1 /TAXON_ID=629695 /ORGANISM="Gymnochlora sp., Strain CCMP2014" /LENGTH=498 /DNA_ID=CAMNT_0007649189 /DNA_START=9 /DNA_END=1505 /DNA_ORIENTATION=+
MPSSKSQEKLVKLIRELRKLKSNKKCFDCTEKVPQYVNITYSTFICEACAGIHRNFNHKVKSISAATFNEDEVADLKAGGNAAAKKLWRALWKESQDPMPDAGDQNGINEFLRKTYVEKRWINKKKKKKKKKSKSSKKYYDEDDGVHHDSVDIDEEEELERKKAKKKKLHAKRNAKREQKQATIESNMKAKTQSSNTDAVKNLFGGLMLDEQPAAAPAPKVNRKPAPVATQKTSSDDWANFGDEDENGDEWADFGKASSTATPSQTKPAPTVKTNTPSLFDAFEDDSTTNTPTIMPTFNITETTPQVEAKEKQSKQDEKKEKAGMSSVLDDPFGDLLGDGESEKPGTAEPGPGPGLDPQAQNSASQQGNLNNSTGNPFMFAPATPASQPTHATTTTSRLPTQNQASIHTMQPVMQGVGMQQQMAPGMANMTPQQQQMMFLQQQQYMMMLQQRQAAFMMMQAQQRQQQGQGNFGGQAQGQPQGGNNNGNGGIDIGNPFL